MTPEELLEAIFAQDPAREGADFDADQLRRNAEKKYGENGSMLGKLDPEFYGDGC